MLLLDGSLQWLPPYLCDPLMCAIGSLDVSTVDKLASESELQVLRK